MWSKTGLLDKESLGNLCTGDICWHVLLQQFMAFFIREIGISTEFNQFFFTVESINATRDILVLVGT